MSRVSFKEFRCLQCGECCRGEGTVRIRSDEFRNITLHLGITRSTALRYYCYRSGEGYILFDQSNKDCIFLRDNGCLINEVKPAQCRAFPSKWNDREMLKQCRGYHALTSLHHQPSVKGEHS